MSYIFPPTMTESLYTIIQEGKWRDFTGQWAIKLGKVLTLANLVLKKILFKYNSVQIKKW